jgi:hypothetical protein
LLLLCYVSIIDIPSDIYFGKWGIIHVIVNYFSWSCPTPEGLGLLPSL